MALTFNTDQTETIAAIATGMSESGIGIIRISGPDAIAIAGKIYRNRRGESGVAGWKANTIHFGYIIDPERETILTDSWKSAETGRVVSADPALESLDQRFHEHNKKNDLVGFAEKYHDAIIDEVMVSIMRAPHSYTTEDTIEINCHGGPYLMNRVLEVVLRQGCRMAAPGEFTKRAFLGGRIDLSRAEAVMDLIESQNEFARKTSIAQLEGSVQDEVRKLREEILYETAYIESALDDPENYSLEGYPDRLRKKCVAMIDELNAVLQFSHDGRILKQGIRTVIVGKPNVGKSSLLNDLMGEERAIVTDVAGTTRDTLVESVHLGDLVLHLTDTAGIHKTSDKVEQIGVQRAVAALDEADLIMFMVDAAGALDEEDAAIARLAAERVNSGARCICLLNKMDLPEATSMEDVRELFRKALMEDGKTEESPESSDGAGQNRISFLRVSVLSKEGMDELREEIERLFHIGGITQRNEVFLSDVRSQSEAANARQSLMLVVKSIDQGMSEDFYSIDLMNAYTALGRIIGEEVEEDLVEEIFSKFCLGK